MSDTDAATLEKKRARAREYQRQRKANDPAYKASQAKLSRDYSKRRWLEDPEFRKKQSQNTYAWRKANKEQYAEYRSAVRARNPARYLLQSAQRRAKRRGIEFSLLESDIQVPEFCPVLGIRLAFARGAPGHASPSLDRIDNKLGYTPGNVRVISHRANSLKKDALLGEILAVYEYMLNEREAR